MKSLLLLVLALCGVEGLSSNLGCPARFVHAVCHFQPDPFAPVTVRGSVTIRQPVDCWGSYGRTEYWVRATGLPPVPALRGMHIHQFADFSNGCDSAGPHYNPLNQTHGGIFTPTRHVGDLGNVVTFADGSINTVVTDFLSGLVAPFPVLGRAIVLHADRDDLGQGGDQESLTSGNSGQRYACCVIQPASGFP